MEGGEDPRPGCEAQRPRQIWVPSELQGPSAGGRGGRQVGSRLCSAPSRGSTLRDRLAAYTAGEGHRLTLEMTGRGWPGL